MNIFDYILLGIMGLFVLWGLFRGLLKEVVSTLGIIAAYWAANTYTEAWAPGFRHWMSNPALMHAAAYLSIFIAVNIAAMILAFILSRALRLTPPAAVEFLGGMAMGAGKGLLVSAVLVLCLSSFFPKAEFVADSRVIPYLRPVIDLLAPYLPERMKRFDPAKLARELQQDKEQGNWLGGGKKDAKEEPAPDKPDAKDAKPGQGQGADMEQVEKMVKDLEKQADTLKNLMNQNKKDQ